MGLSSCNGAATSPCSDVYLELNRNAEDPAVGCLADEACLLLGDGEYARPGAVFRQANPFGRFGRLLGPDFDAIGSLLDRLGVKRLPDHRDARDVLIDISGEEDRRFHVPVDDEDDLAVIWRCWQMLDEALANGDVDPAWFAPLRNLPVIPNDAGILTPPTRLLVDDMPGVAAALNIGQAVIRRKEGMWRAFQAAGVRSLTEAVTVEILHMRETTRDGAVRARMQDRRTALARILDEDPDGIQRLAAALGELSFPESPALRVRYHLPDFRPGPEAPAAGDAHSAGPTDDEAGRSSSGAGSESTPGIDGRGQRADGQPGQPRGRTPAASEPADRVRHRVPHGRLRSYVVTGRDGPSATGA